MPKSHFEIEPGDNVVVYPRAYHVDLIAPEKSWGHGVCADGKQVVFAMDPEGLSAELAKQQTNHKFNLPSIEAFSSGPRNLGCVPSNENAPEKSAGILLLSRVKAESTNDFSELGTSTLLKAGYASVLAHNSSESRPEFGVGYIEMQPVLTEGYDITAAETNNLLQSLLITERKYGRLPEDSPLRATIGKEVDFLRAQVDHAVKFKFSAVNVLYNELTHLEAKDFIDAEALAGKLGSIMSKHTNAGRVGGCYIRAIDKGTGLVSMFSGRIKPIYQVGRSLYMPSPIEAAHAYLKTVKGHNLLNCDLDRLRVEIIPTSSTNFGPLANQEWKDKAEWIRNTYLHPVKMTPVARKLVTKTIKLQGKGDILSAGTYATSKMLGHPLLLDANLNEAYSFSTRLDLSNRRDTLKLGQSFVIQYQGQNVVGQCRKHPETGAPAIFVNDEVIPNAIIVRGFDTQPANSAPSQLSK